jgi:hypothetical protein
MVKNTKGGNKAKSQKNSSAPIKNREIPLPEKDDDSHVAIITKIHGDGRYLCDLIGINGKNEENIPVNLSKGTKNKYGRGIIISLGTYVLVSKREFQKDKGDIIFIYKDSELDFLVGEGIINITKTNKNNENLSELFFSESANTNFGDNTNVNSSEEETFDISGI